MAVVVVQENFQSSGSGTEATYDATLGAGTTEGNMLFLVVSSDATVATPSGFTLDRSQVNNNGHYVFRKATVADETSWTFDPGGSSSTAWWIAEVSGLDSDPADQAVSTGSGSGVASRSTGTTGTTDTADEWLVASMGFSDSGNPPPSVSSWDNSFVIQGTSATTKSSGTNTRIGVALRTVSSTATYETTGTLSATSICTAILVTYRIAAEGASGSGAISEQSDDATGAGAVLVSGAGAVAEVADNASGVGTILVSGSGAITEQSDDATGIGTILVSGAGAISEQADSVSGAGNVVVSGAGTVAEQPDDATGAGSTAITGSGTITESSDIVAGAGNILISGSGAITELPDNATGVGSTGAVAVLIPTVSVVARSRVSVTGRRRVKVTDRVRVT